MSAAARAPGVSPDMRARTVPEGAAARKVFLICGILAALLYGTMMAAIRFPGYNPVSQTVSELSAVGVPTRPLWIILGSLYEVLIVAFGAGVWMSAGGNRPLRAAGALFVVAGILGGLAWPFAPMHQRAVLAAGGATLSDTLHIILGALTVLFMLVAIAFGAAAFGTRFRVYSVATIVVLLAFGALAGMDGPRVGANLPTPWVGLWERINIYGFLLWVAVLAIVLWRRRDTSAGERDAMTTLKAIIARHPVLSYFTLAFAISWGGALATVGPGVFRGATQVAFARLGPAAYVAFLAGPSVAGVLLTGLVHGRAGLRNLRSNLLRWRVGLRWYAIALLTAPLLMTGISFVLSRMSPVYLPAIATTPDRTGLLVFSITFGLVGPFFEELGWTGFAVPALRRRCNTLTTGLAIGVLWGAWHFPLFSASPAPSAAIAPALQLAVLLFSWLPPYRVLMVWVYDHTESVILAVLMHFPITAMGLLLSSPAMSGVPVVISDLILGATLWAVIAAVALTDRGSLSRPPLRGQPARGAA